MARMIALTLVGFFGALGHHFYYTNLHGQVISRGTQWPPRFGLALAFFIKLSFVASVEIAYRQQVWVSVKKRSFKVSTLDILFSAWHDPFAFLDMKFLSNAYLPAILAAFIWILPLSAIASPSSLTVRNGDQTSSETCGGVPTLDFTRENGFGVDSDDQERAGMSYWGFDRPDALYTYNSPSSEVNRVFQLTLLSFTGPLKPYSPCPSYKSCVYTIDIVAPVYKCQDRQEFGDDNPLGYNASQLGLNGTLLYASYSSFEEDIGGRPLEWGQMPPSAAGFGVFDRLPSFWVGWVTQDRHPHIAECLLYNAITSYQFTFSGDNISMNRTSTSLGSLLLPEGSVKAPWESDYQQFSGYHGAGYLFRTFLSGNVTSDPISGWIDNTAAVQTQWFNATTGLILSDDFTTILEGRFQDFFLSMVGDTVLHSQLNSSVPCATVESVLIWDYAPFWLALSYILALVLSVAALAMGLYGFYQNGYSMNASFSTLIATTRSADVDKLCEGHSLGQSPMRKDILATELKFGELVGSQVTREGARHQAAFALPDNVQMITELRHFTHEK
ncbi:hypothetical protein F5Y08DRAFT_348922 [Xylaria arbuscula]|nr:hypothetical protein F5Y08DRAFT_348922 [Xylaria arbuscula]